jgi:hypothetical protein
MPEKRDVTAQPRTWGERDVAEQREHAEHYLIEYAEAIKFWNAPDDAHTRIQLRSLVESIIDMVVPRV